MKIYRHLSRNLRKNAADITHMKLKDSHMGSNNM